MMAFVGLLAALWIWSTPIDDDLPCTEHGGECNERINHEVC